MNTTNTKSTKWPRIELATVFHVGTMQQGMKGQTHNKHSQEGNGLSVSLDPDAWSQIAKLGGQPKWTLTNEAGPSVFIDRHEMSSSHWFEVVSWALENGYIEPAKIAEISWRDPETEEMVMSEYDIGTPEQESIAHDEYEACAQDEYEDLSMEIVEGWRPTPIMDQRLGFQPHLSFTKDMALTLFVESVLFDRIGAQGVWWNDIDDPGNYSAPRGVIHKRALPTWNSTLSESHKRKNRHRERE